MIKWHYLIGLSFITISCLAMNGSSKPSYPGYTFFHEFIVQKAEKNGITIDRGDKKINPDAMSSFIKLSNKKGKTAYDLVEKWEKKTEGEAITRIAHQNNISKDILVEIITGVDMRIQKNPFFRGT